MNKIQKRKLYESIMSSTAKVVKRKLNEMTTKTNVLADLKQMIDDYSNENNISSIEIKNALDTLSRKWNISTSSVSNTYNSIQDFFKAIIIKRLNGLTGPIDKKDFLYLQKYLRKSLDFASYSDDDPDFVFDVNEKQVDKFLTNALQDICKLIEKRNNTLFGIKNENVQLLYDVYFTGDFIYEGIYRLFVYLIEGRVSRTADHYTVEEDIDLAVNNAHEYTDIFK